MNGPFSGRPWQRTVQAPHCAAHNRCIPQVGEAGKDATREKKKTLACLLALS